MNGKHMQKVTFPEQLPGTVKQITGKRRVIGSTINAASTVLGLLVLGWGFTFFGQLISRQAEAVDPEVDKVLQTLQLTKSY